MSLERCPACRARLTREPACPRCGCDLTLVRRAEAQAAQRLALALRAWQQGRLGEAESHARAASMLERSRLAVAVLKALAAPPAHNQPASEPAPATP